METGVIEKKSLISRKNDEAIFNIVPNNYESTIDVTTYETGKNGFCYPAVCIRSQTGKETAFCWCCSSNRFCAKAKSDCTNACS